MDSGRWPRHARCRLVFTRSSTAPSMLHRLGNCFSGYSISLRPEGFWPPSGTRPLQKEAIFATRNGVQGPPTCCKIRPFFQHPAVAIHLAAPLLKGKPTAIRSGLLTPRVPRPKRPACDTIAAKFINYQQVCQYKPKPLSAIRPRTSAQAALSFSRFRLSARVNSSASPEGSLRRDSPASTVCFLAWLFLFPLVSFVQAGDPARPLGRQHCRSRTDARFARQRIPRPCTSRQQLATCAPHARP